MCVKHADVTRKPYICTVRTWSLVAPSTLYSRSVQSEDDVMSKRPLGWKAAEVMGPLEGPALLTLASRLTYSVLGASLCVLARRIGLASAIGTLHIAKKRGRLTGTLP